MSSKPYDFADEVPGVTAAPTFVARRARATSDRNRGAWRFVRRKTSYVEPVATPDDAGIASQTSALLVARWHYDAQERLSSERRHAGFSEALEPLGLPDGPRAEGSDSCWRVRGTQANYAGRLITFNLAVVVIHLAMLRWIFLPIGG